MPGWGATARLYERGLPEGWEALELPSYRTTRGDFPAYRRWLVDEVLPQRGRVALGGHSMGAVLALLAAVERPAVVERLVLVSPAGLPLEKTMRASSVTFVRQVVTGRYRLVHLGRMVGRVAWAPVSALRLAQTVKSYDVRSELGAGVVHCIVVGCSTDTLTPPSHCRELAAALGAEYREVDARDGHIWPVTQPELLAAALSG